MKLNFAIRVKDLDKLMPISDLLTLLLLGALWGGSFLFMRIASPVLGPVWLSEIRVLIGGFALLLLLARLGLVSEIRVGWMENCLDDTIFSLGDRSRLDSVTIICYWGSLY